MALLLAAWTLAGCAAVVETVPGVAGVAIPVERDLDDPSGAATGIRVGQCGAGFDVMIAVPDLAALDRMVDAGRGGAGGMYDVGGQELFVGRIEAAAVALGGNALFIGKRGDSWIRTGPGSARQLVAFETPRGRQAWLLTSASAITPCGVDGHR